MPYSFFMSHPSQCEKCGAQADRYGEGDTIYSGNCGTLKGVLKIEGYPN
jgi:hypothetical protein